MARPPVPAIERFRAKYDVAPSGCWLWTGPLLSDGYGTFFTGRSKPNGQPVNARAHRWSYEHFVGPIPEGKLVCHRCDTPLCVNPDHLFLGDPGANSADMRAKGRSPKATNGHAKLRPEQVEEIRSLYQQRAKFKVGHPTQRELAARFGITQSQVSKIIRGSSW